MWLQSWLNLARRQWILGSATRRGRAARGIPEKLTPVAPNTGVSGWFLRAGVSFSGNPVSDWCAQDSHRLNPLLRERVLAWDRYPHGAVPAGRSRWSCLWFGLAER